jgi:acetylornithine deacetylase/succinyl-diaminopimelate desuccinylase-like protein
MRLRVALLAASLVVVAPAVGARANERVNEATGWLQAYLRYDTSNPPGGEGPAAAYLASLLHRHGIATRRLISPTGRTSLYARVESPAPTAGTLVLLHHIDVVPPGEGWTFPAFDGEIVDGKIRGRGSIDAKSLGIAHLQAFLEAASHRDQLHRDVVYLAAADEEQGGVEGVRWLLEEHGELFDDAALVLNEGGSNRVVAGRLLWWGIEVVQKRPLWLRLEATGRGGHASGFHPGSPTHLMVEALSRVLAIEHGERVGDAALIFFGAIAPFHRDSFQTVFQQPTAESASGALAQSRAARTSPLLPGMDVYLKDTIQVTSFKSGGDSINVVAPSAIATLDARLLPDTDEQAFLDRVRAAVGPGISVEVVLRAPVQIASPVDHDDYRVIQRLLEPSAPVVPAFILGTTDSRYFRERGVPAYGFWPFVLDGDDNRGIHGKDEAIPVDKFLAGVELMRRAVRGLAYRSEEPAH